MFKKLFVGMLIVIGTVSLIDTWLIIQFQVDLPNLEENPIGLWLIQANHGDVSLFVFTKLIGTVLVLSILAAMYYFRYRRTLPVTTSVTTFQLGLLSYLALA